MVNREIDLSSLGVRMTELLFPTEAACISVYAASGPLSDGGDASGSVTVAVAECRWRDARRVG